MTRDSFVFYRSFHEAIKYFTEKVQAQIYIAIADYALDGIEPKNLCKEALGIFMIIRPIIDNNNKRYRNGKLGGIYGKLGGRPKKNADDIPPAPDVPPPYSQSFADETKQMKEEAIWMETVCMQFNILKDEAENRLERFRRHCETECSDKPHESLADAKRHFCSWMRKSYKKQEVQLPQMDEPDAPPKYTFNGGFGGMDT